VLSVDVSVVVEVGLTSVLTNFTMSYSTCCSARFFQTKRSRWFLCTMNVFYCNIFLDKLTTSASTSLTAATILADAAVTPPTPK